MAPVSRRQRRPADGAHHHDSRDAAAPPLRQGDDRQRAQHSDPGGALLGTSGNNIYADRISWRLGPTDHHYRRIAAAQEHDALPGAQLLHRAAGHFPLTELRRRGWPNRTLAKYACSRELRARGLDVLRWPVCRSPRTKRCSHLIGTTYGGDGEETFQCRIFRAASRSISGPARRNHLSARRNGGHRIGDADDAADPEPHPYHARLVERREHGKSDEQGDRQSANALYMTPGSHGPMNAAAVTPARRQPAARELPAVPLHQLHHFAVRDLPEQT